MIETNMSKPIEIITNENPMTATWRDDVRGWVSADGKYYGAGPEAERLARWSACTHVRCGCGLLVEKRWTHCEWCREKNRHERWEKLPVGNWGGTGIIYSDRLGDYMDADEVEENKEEHGDLDLIICDPIRLRHIEEEDWHDDLATEDGCEDLPQAVLDAIDALNREIDKMDAVTWAPGRFRIPND